MLERGQSVNLMELYIETLTGAAFEMRVHPADTVQDVKARIQKMEGIPITQQHLIWESTELADDCCLSEYNIQDHSTLKLVLTLRGGPINTRRISLNDDSSYGDLEFDSDFGADDLDMSGLPFTVIVYHDSGRMKFFRILERESSSKSTDSIDEDGETGGDGSALKHKMDILRLKMEKVHLDRKMKKLVLPHPPSNGRPSNRFRQPFFRRSTSLFTTSATSSSVTTSNEQTLNVDQSVPNIGSVATIENNPAKISLGHITETLVDKTVTVPQCDVTVGCVESVKNVSPASEAVAVCTGVAVSDNSKQGELLSSVQPQPKDTSVKVAEESQKTATSKKPLSATFPAPSRPPLCSAHSMRMLQRVPETDVEELSPCTAGPGRPQSTDNMAAASLTRRRRSPACSSGRHSATTVVMETMDPLEVRSVLRSIVRSTGATGLALIGSSSRRTRIEEPIDLGLPTTRRQVSVSGGASEASPVSAVPELPSVVRKPTKSVTKCFTCAKKTGLATSYMCRCGNNFCATHRYAEVHACSYDYKGEGRKLLQQDNPVVACPKLPKI